MSKTERLRSERGSSSEARKDWARFFGTWIRHPMKVGAVAPSSPRYCATMVEHAHTHLSGRILELGPGLGVVTKALIDKGVAPERITSIEYDPAFARTLQERFPRVEVICGDGINLDKTLAGREEEKFAAILFAIPVMHWPQERRQRYFQDLIGRLQPAGNITQLSYKWTAPVKPVPGVLDVSSSPVVWENIPPARVWIYSPASAGNAAQAA